MAPTRPRGEQLRFASSKTGEHILDTYLEAAEKGSRTLGDLLSDWWDATTGTMRTDLYGLRINPVGGELQFRVGDFVDPNAGWRSTASYVLRPRGAWSSGATYKRLDVVTLTNILYIALTDHVAGSSFDASKWSETINVGLVENALKLNGQTASYYATATAQTATASSLSSHLANTSNPHNTTKAQVGLANVDNTSDSTKPISTATQAALNGKVPTGTTINGYPLTSNVALTRADVGLGQVDNTSDASKPISTLTQSALDGKVPTTRTVAGKSLSSNVTLAKADVGLANVDNTSDVNKPVSSATQAAIDALGVPSIITALSKRLRVDDVQSFSSAEISQARSNLGISTFVQALLDDADATIALGTLSAVGYNVQALTEAQKLQALANIGSVGVVGQTLAASQQRQALANLGTWREIARSEGASLVGMSALVYDMPDDARRWRLTILAPAVQTGNAILTLRCGLTGGTLDAGASDYYSQYMIVTGGTHTAGAISGSSHGVMLFSQNGVGNAVYEGATGSDSQQWSAMGRYMSADGNGIYFGERSALRNANGRRGRLGVSIITNPGGTPVALANGAVILEVAP